MKGKMCKSVVVLVVLATVTASWAVCMKEYCYPGEACWPSPVDIALLKARLRGILLQPFDAGYVNEVAMKNARFTKSPGLVVKASTVQDVQEAVLFAKKFNIRLTVLSSGHDRTGKSTADGSLQVNMSGMKGRVVRLDDPSHEAGTITVQSGNTWNEVYQEVDRIGRVIAGGSSTTVAMGGYTLGGGHGPLSRTLGLAVDNLLQVEMVTANGVIVTASAESNPDLFWAVRGGGGGTFGIISSFTFKLHIPPDSMVSLLCGYPLVSEQDTQIGKQILSTYLNYLPTLPEKWGGHFVTSESYPGLIPDTEAAMVVALLHYGPWSAPTRTAVQPLIDELSSLQISCDYTEVASFWEWKRNFTDDASFRSYVSNVFLHYDSLRPELANLIVDSSNGPLSQETNARLSCTFSLLGGKVSSVPVERTAVSPAFRTALVSLTCGTGWQNPINDDINAANMMEFGKRLREFGNGVYFSEAEQHLPNWKNDFWGPHYPRLVETKRAWDPNNTFFCPQCVGSESVGITGCNITMVKPEEQRENSTTERPPKSDFTGVKFCSRFCSPGHTCWPSLAEVTKLASSLDGTLMTPNMKDYGSTVIMKDTLYTKEPGIVVLPKTSQDVQRALRFAKRYNIRLTIRSSGHDYNGRSTADGSLNIDFVHMKARKVNLNDARSSTGATLYAETGNTWHDVYREIDKYDKQIVGGSAQTVAMGGYTTGGGHSIFSRTLGLAVDNVVEFEIVLADGTLATASANGTVFLADGVAIGRSPSSDLFWAVLGGGGGTFGVVTSFTYKLHPAPPQIVGFTCVYPINVDSDIISRDVLNLFHTLLPTLSPKWGGYYLITALEPGVSNRTVGSLTFAFMHNGPWEDPSVNDVRPLMNFMKEYQYYCQYANYTSYLEYKGNKTDEIFYRTYVFNRLLQNDSLTPELTETMLSGFTNPSLGLYGCTGTMLGGKIKEIPVGKTPVHPGLRSALSSLTCGIAWQDPRADPINIAVGKQLGKKLNEHGNGVYLNEPEKYLPTWKEDFWGPNYDRLLSIKQQWDRDGLFYCHHCVGSDLIEQFSCNQTFSRVDQVAVEETKGCEAYRDPPFHDGPMTSPLNQGVGFCSRYCLLGHPCWPTDAEFSELAQTLSGTGLIQTTPGFQQTPLAGRLSNAPAIVVLPKTMSDIQRTLDFGRRYNLRIGPVASDMEIHGPLLDSSLLIILADMNSVQVNLNDPNSPTGASVSTDLGASWEQVLNEVERYRKVLVGANEPETLLLDFMTAGGYGPLARTLGLAVDNVIGFDLVLPDGVAIKLFEKTAVMTYLNGTSLTTMAPELFWALRGGGGDTFGIVSGVTFAIHDAPEAFVHYLGVWRLNNGSDSSYGRDMLEQFHRVLPELSPKWGGEIVSIPQPPENGFNGTIAVSLLHFGEMGDPSMQDVQLIQSIEPDGQLMSQMANYTSFAEFQKTVGSNNFIHEYGFNTFLQYESDPRRIADFIVNVTLDYGTCRETLIGGKVSQARADSAAINPKFRTALTSLTCAFVWNDTSISDEVSTTAREYSEAIGELGEGAYLSDVDTNLPDWQEDVWGPHYTNLIELKEEYDPYFLLTCENCLGAERILEFYNETYSAPEQTTQGYLRNYTKSALETVDFAEENEFVSRFCIHGLPCWPSNAEFVSLNTSLDGTILRPRDAGYSDHTHLRNKLRSRSPGAVVFPRSVADVQRAVLFAREHNLRVTVVSSGHSFNGKSTADGSFQINLSRLRRIHMDPIDTNSPTSESVTVEGGVSWGDVYQEVNKWSRRTVVGPSSLSVSPAGYTMGGGFSPLSPSLGLALDNTIAIQMVTADGRIVNATKSGTRVMDIHGNVTSTENTDLFRALRGGGGGTFGIVTALTYQIHQAPPEFVQFSCIFAPLMHSAEETKTAMHEVVRFFNSMVKTLPEEWGGQFIVSNTQGMGGSSFAAVQLLHSGPWDKASRRAVEPFFGFRKEWQLTCRYSQHKSFWDYARLHVDLPLDRTYIANGLTSAGQIGRELTDMVVDQVFSTDGNSNAKTCFYDILGGKVSAHKNSVDSLNPLLRDAVLSVVCSVTWLDVAGDAANVAAGRNMSQAVYNVTDGVYLNYAAYDLPNWKTDFWGNKYDDLLTVKKTWDPENFFYCRHCVGSELVSNFREQTRPQYRPKEGPGTTAPKKASNSAAHLSPLTAVLLSFVCLLLKNH
ncbi:uncharacterized protein LOC135477143 [Liolophura sinensis]|uniref:uncharacterized protein LOC135477143 n=1 Tax=Liolophura sinensis TaxID=3198878 RepID=UPI00315954FF